MRAVLWLLLLANLGYLGWNVYQLRQPQPEPVAAAPSRGMVERLHLVEEVEAVDEDAEAPPPVPAPIAEAPPPAPIDERPAPSVPETVPAAEPPDSVAEAVAESPPPTEPLTETPSPLSATTAEDERPPSEGGAAVAESGAETVAGETPRERPAAGTAAGAAAAPVLEPPDLEQMQVEAPPPGPEVTSLTPGRCVYLGPLPEETDAQAVLTLLAEADIAAQLETRREERPYRYWIYLPQFPSTAAARSALERLREAEVTDFIRVMQGPNTNAVSLGLYSQERSARNRIRELETKGFDAEMEIRYQAVKERWLRLTMAEDQSLPRARLERLMGDLPETTPCP